MEVLRWRLARADYRAAWDMARERGFEGQLAELRRGSTVLLEFCTDAVAIAEAAKKHNKVDEFFRKAAYDRLDVVELLLDEPLAPASVGEFIRYYEPSRYGLMVRLFERHPVYLPEVAVTPIIIKPAFPYIWDRVDTLFREGAPSIITELAGCCYVPTHALVRCVEEGWDHTLRDMAELGVVCDRPDVRELAERRAMHWALLPQVQREKLAAAYGVRIRELRYSDLRCVAPPIADPIELWVALLAHGMRVKWRRYSSVTRRQWLAAAAVAEPGVDYGSVLF